MPIKPNITVGSYDNLFSLYVSLYMYLKLSAVLTGEQWVELQGMHLSFLHIAALEEVRRKAPARQK